MKYFIDDNIWYKGKYPVQQKIKLISVSIEPNGKYAICKDAEGDEYRLRLEDIKEE